MSTDVAYLVNQYPKVSHTFIRREIAGLEADGLAVSRFSIRSCGAGDLVDADDRRELDRTQFVLSVGMARLACAALHAAITRPVRLARAIGAAMGAGWRSDRGVFRHVIYLAEACVLLRWLRKSGSRHLHAHFGTNSATVAMLCRMLGGPPYSFTVHGPEEFDKPQGLSLGEKIRNASFVVAISEFGRSQLYRWCEHSQWAKIRIVPCGVDAPLLARPHVPVPHGPRLVCVGRLCEQKGQLLLLDAAGLLAAQGVEFELALVGDGPMRPEVEGLIARMGLRDCVTITGWASADQVAAQIEWSRALVLPSFAEGLPVVIMEALALGRPVISTFTAGIPELVEPGVCGWLVPPGSVEALASVMREALCLPPARLEQMGRAGAERVARRHDVRTNARTLAELLRASIESERSAE